MDSHPTRWIVARLLTPAPRQGQHGEAPLLEAARTIPMPGSHANLDPAPRDTHPSPAAPGASTAVSASDARYRFGTFELNVPEGRLRKAGKLVRLPPQPLRLLALLLSRPGDLLTRDEIARVLWGEAAAVDAEQGLNACVREIRAALGDQADTPRFVQTLPRRGYRFIHPVERLSGTAAWHSRPRGRIWVALTLGAAAAASVVWLAWRGPAQAPEEPRVRLVVLPFEDLGGPAEAAYFGDGLTEEMIAQLGRLQPRRLGVIARTTAMRYKGAARDVAEIGRELNVDYALEGSVRLSAERVRVAARLLRVADRTQLWSETYERDVKDVLSLQHELARDIARGIRLALPSVPARAAASLDPEAYRLYLRGRHFLARRGEDSVRRAIELFEQAVAREPDYALAHVGIADAWGSLADYGIVSSREAGAQALRAASRAAALAPDLAETQTTLATLAKDEWDWTRAESLLRRAIDLNPSYAPARQRLSRLLRMFGQGEQAVEQARLAVESDPLSPSVNHTYTVTLLYAGRRAEALAQAHSTLELDPVFPAAHYGLGRVLLAEGRHEDAVAAFRRARELSDRLGAFAASLGHACAVSGRHDEAGELLTELRETGQRTYVAHVELALVHVGLGERDQALAAIERAFEERAFALRFLAVDERFAPLAGDPRFRGVLERMGLPAPAL
jgi:TolB-like protein/DNA-binding winged helix-turn-helix (wHTH) protein/Flp pilus assembly protein TadD